MRSLRLFLSGVIVGAMVAWWFRPRWEDANALVDLSRQLRRDIESHLARAKLPAVTTPPGG